MKLTLSLCVLLNIMCGLICSHIYNERLYVKVLPDLLPHFQFQFQTQWNGTMGNQTGPTHYDMFPKSLGEVIDKYNVHELHLTLTQGFWRHRSWGYTLHDASPGAELWVWFNENTFDVDISWVELSNVLSGIFCSSLNFMDEKAIVSPKLSFRHLGAFQKIGTQKSSSPLLRYAALPREIVCTENLTPWKKLLPCGSKIGLSELLNALKIYNSVYHSLAVHFRPVCADTKCIAVHHELDLTVSVVLDPTVHDLSVAEWSFKKLFGRTVSNICGIATESTVFVDMSRIISLSPQPNEINHCLDDGIEKQFAIYRLNQNKNFETLINMEVKVNTSNIPQKNDYYSSNSKFFVTRYQTGYGLEKGGIIALIYNFQSTPLNVIYLDTLPWFLRLYIHSLKLEMFHVSDISFQTGNSVIPDLIHYQAGKDRLRPYLLELVFTLKANSVIRVSFEFDRALLKWTEYPPDANHGFYIGSAIITTQFSSATDLLSNDSCCFGKMRENMKFIRLRSEPLLVHLPTPDFSMPYNVICLTCTVIAIAFGSVHNLTTRQFTAVNSKKANLLYIVKQKFSTIWERLCLIYK